MSTLRGSDGLPHVWPAIHRFHPSIAEHHLLENRRPCSITMPESQALLGAAMPRRRHAFTLIELLVVISIIGPPRRPAPARALTQAPRVRPKTSLLPLQHAAIQQSAPPPTPATRSNSSPSARCTTPSLGQPRRPPLVHRECRLTSAPIRSPATPPPPMTDALAGRPRTTPGTPGARGPPSSPAQPTRATTPRRSPPRAKSNILHLRPPPTTSSSGPAASPAPSAGGRGDVDLRDQRLHRPAFYKLPHPRAPGSQPPQNATSSTRARAWVFPWTATVGPARAPIADYAHPNGGRRRGNTPAASMQVIHGTAPCTTPRPQRRHPRSTIRVLRRPTPRRDGSSKTWWDASYGSELRLPKRLLARADTGEYVLNAQVARSEEVAM